MSRVRISGGARRRHESTRAFKLRVRRLRAWTVWSDEIQEERESKQLYLWPQKICSDPATAFISRAITDSRKFQSNRLVTPKLRGMCWHHFFWKNRSKGIRRSNWWKMECNRPIEEREGRPTRFTDGQRNSILIVGQRVKAIDRW
jgi:hypothetical protein